jgi:hypothetical protein
VREIPNWNGTFTYRGRTAEIFPGKTSFSHSQLVASATPSHLLFFQVNTQRQKQQINKAPRNNALLLSMSKIRGPTLKSDTVIIWIIKVKYLSLCFN